MCTSTANLFFKKCKLLLIGSTHLIHLKRLSHYKKGDKHHVEVNWIGKRV